MKDFIKQIAESNGWGFSYGREDFHNLYDGLDDDIPVIFLDPVKFRESFNERGRVDFVEYDIKMLVSVSSNFNECDYETRYDNYILPIAAGAYKTIKNAFKCSPDTFVKSSNATEVINSGDFNVDGLAITLVVKSYIND